MTDHADYLIPSVIISQHDTGSFIRRLAHTTQAPIMVFYNDVDTLELIWDNAVRELQDDGIPHQLIRDAGVIAHADGKPVVRFFRGPEFASRFNVKTILDASRYPIGIEHHMRNQERENAIIDLAIKRGAQKYRVNLNEL